MEWNEAAIATLRALWAEGLSTAKIGRRMGISKNSVVGKAHRLNLTQRENPVQAGPIRHLRARDLHSQGLAPREIAYEIRVAASVIEKWLDPNFAPGPKVKVVHRIELPKLVSVTPTPAEIEQEESEPEPEIVYEGLVTDCQHPMTNGKPWRFCETDTLPGKSYCKLHHATNTLKREKRTHAVEPKIDIRLSARVFG